MKILKFIYKKIKKKEAPYYYDYSLLVILAKPLRKFIAQVVAPNCPFNRLRVLIYKICGFRIGKHCFIGMHCYLDDMCFDILKIGNNVSISYGVFFACHGPKQDFLPITIEDNVYIGMRACVISKSTSDDGIVIGKGSIIGACTLVNKSIPKESVVVGIPCKIIKERK